MKTISALLILAFGINSYAQVGFNNPDPDESAILDLSATDKGLLIPRMTTNERTHIATPANGLLVYDIDLQGFFYYNAQWYSIGGWVKTIGSNNTTLSGTATMTNATITSSASISGTMNSGSVSTGNITSTGTLTATGANVSGTVNGGTLHATGNVTASGNVVATGTVQAATLVVSGFSNNALVPSGVIVMWSGTTPPQGWALCDGGAGRPNLRGRFIVGYSGSGQYASVGNVGGQDNVTLNTNNLPAHTHPINDQHGGSTLTGRTIQSIDPAGGAASLATTAVNSTTNAPFDNRPAYYVLAYIIKE